MFARVTHIFQALWSTLSQFSLSDWGALAAIIVGPITLVGVIIAWWPLWRQYRIARRLTRQFGADFYDQATINNSTLYYVRQQCTNIDPTLEAELRRIFPVKEPLFKAIDRFLSDKSDYRHCILLADSGMGKTSFVLNYYVYNQQRSTRKRHRLAVVPLGSRRAMEYIRHIHQPQETVLFLDAFDEDAPAITDHRQRLFDLMTASEMFKRVLITCRTQFFPTDEEIPQETGLMRADPRAVGSSKRSIFWKFYLAPFDDAEVAAFLRRRYPWRWMTRRRAQQLVETIPLLSIRPMLLAYIPDLLETRSPITTAYELYTVMVEKWIEREQPGVQPDALRAFSERLAVVLYRNWQAGESDRRHYTTLEPLALEWHVDLEDWQLRGRSLLNRDAEGNYKFAHRSIMEYLVVRRLLQGDDACRHLPLTDLMHQFLREADLRGADLHEADLEGINLHGVNLQGANLCGANLRSANLQGVILEGANLKDATLDEANLESANLVGVRHITAQQVVRTSSWAQARLDEPLQQIVNQLLTLRSDLPVSERVQAGDELARLGDPRFRADAWYLPDEPLLGFVEIPAGPFLMGSDPKNDGNATARERPQHEVHLSTYYIARYPVTVAQFHVFVESSGYELADPNCLSGVSNHPVVHVSWSDAVAYCDWLTERLRAWADAPESSQECFSAGARIRLPTEAEWEKAARGSDGRMYPWGNYAPYPNLANYGKTGINATNAVGCFPDGLSPYGVEEMSGNVWEWVQD